MAWTIIPDSDIDPDSPVTTGLMTALRDNVAAAFAGDSGAPDLVEAALTAITVGSSYRIASADLQDAESVHSGNAYTRQNDITVPRTGSYRVTFELKATTARTAYGRVYRNASTGYTGDVAFGTEQTTTSTSFVTKTQTMNLNAGDVISLYSRSSVPDPVTIRNFRIDSAVKQHG